MGEDIRLRNNMCFVQWLLEYTRVYTVYGLIRKFYVFCYSPLVILDISQTLWYHNDLNKILSTVFICILKIYFMFIIWWSRSYENHSYVKLIETIILYRPYSGLHEREKKNYQVHCPLCRKGEKTNYGSS